MISDSLLCGCCTIYAVARIHNLALYSRLEIDDCRQDKYSKNDQIGNQRLKSVLYFIICKITYRMFCERLGNLYV